MTQSRRSVLALGAAALAGSLAGCSSDEKQSFEEHSAADGIADQPTLGDSAAPATIVGFEDPSCISCEQFEAETFPAIQRDLIEPGDATFVYRTLDITFPWSKPASQLMASTYAADAAVFWELKEFYYENRDDFETDNVVELTEPFLEDSAVDAAAVIDDARNRVHDDWLEANRSAADAAVPPVPRWAVPNGGYRAAGLRRLRERARVRLMAGRLTRRLPALPSSGDDLRLMGRTARLVLSVPTSAALAVVGAFFGLSAFVFSLNVPLVTFALTGSLPASGRATILLSLYPFVGTAFDAVQGALLVAVAALFGVDIPMVGYHLREHGVSLSGGGSGAVGAVLGALGAGCAACGSALLVGILSLFGVSASLLFLPLDGLEFALLALFALLLSIYWVAEGMRGGEIGGCPVDI
jgi:protein-disulfide isomerase